ncbi:hypothetical protein [Virgibacillus doumboii]|nr:hypothetical protein [Virgibacillus doumboii]
MVEQEHYKNMLKKMIEDTENAKFESTEELVQALIQELKHGSPIANNTN